MKRLNNLTIGEKAGETYQGLGCLARFQGGAVGIWDERNEFSLATLHKQLRLHVMSCDVSILRTTLKTATATSSIRATVSGERARLQWLPRSSESTLHIIPGECDKYQVNTLDSMILRSEQSVSKG